MANLQPAPDPNAVDMTGLYQDLMRGVDPNELPPVPQQGPYGDPSIERDQGPPQASNAPNPLAVALSGGMPGLPVSPASPAPSPQGQSPGFLDALASALAGTPPSTGSRYNPQTGEFLPEGARSVPAGSYAQPSAAPPPAAASAPSSGPSVPIAGQVSDIGNASAEDATTAAYRALHASEVAEFQRTKSLAQQAAAAGNTEMAKAYAEAASAAYKRANDITLLSIKHNEPTGDSYQPVTLPNGQIVSFNKSTGEYGTPYGPGGAKAKAPQWEQTGTDIYGNPIKGWVTPPEPGAIPAGQLSVAPAPVPISGPYGVPSTGVAPAASVAQPTIQDAANAITAGRTAGLTGEDLLKTLPAAIADHARAIVAGDEPMPVTGIAQTKPIEQLTADAVRAAYPGTSAADFAARAQAKKDMAPGGKDQMMIEKLNSAVGHSTDQLAVGQGMNNAGSATLNALEDQFYPSSAPISQKVAQFNNLGQLAGPELQSVYTPTGGGEAERMGQAHSMGPYMSPEEMEAVHASRMRAVAERVGAIDKQFNDAMGPNVRPWAGLTDQTVQQLQKYANDKLPARLQARGADGQPLAPASVDNGFRFGATGPAPLPAPALEGMAESHPFLTAGGLLAAPAIAAIGGGGAKAIGGKVAPYVAGAFTNPLAKYIAGGVGIGAAEALGRKLIP